MSGMSKDNDAVQLFDGNKFIGNMALENGYYIYTVNDSISADVLTIHAKDANGYKTIKKISEIDSSKKDSYYMEKETPTLNSTFLISEADFFIVATISNSSLISYQSLLSITLLLKLRILEVELNQ